MTTMCKGTSTSPNWIKLEMADNYFIEAVTIWRPFESSSYTEDRSQQEGQRFEVKNLIVIIICNHFIVIHDAFSSNPGTVRVLRVSLREPFKNYLADIFPLAENHFSKKKP